ncbi:MFS transporter [Kitasatospora sp. RG8]|uniref:MFS transporter n=1 Tax=Kitasatospora sp. RG8 TaxID=2820815 RepID=UPI0027DB82F0|nr:MFS transporter [Kitasatospora sp. RG8]
MTVEQIGGRRSAPGPCTARPAAGADGRGTALVWVLAVVCGVAVGNVYFPQALVPLVGEGFGVSADSASAVVTAVQVGYAAGIFLVVPLGDRVRARTLLVALLGASGVALLAAAAAPSLPVLVGASAVVGVTTVAAPVVGPMAAGLVDARRRGVVGGTLLSGSLGGMLLSRVLGGVVGEGAGWRAVYAGAAVLTGVAAVAVARVVPTTVPPSGDRYPALLAEPLRLLRREPELRRSAAYQAAVFAGFSAVWTGVALLLTGPAYGLGAGAVGALALVNAATMFCTPVAGRWVDRLGSDAVNLVCLVAVVGAGGVLALGALGGAVGLTALVAGTLLLDVGMQSGMVANQVRIYTLPGEARSRLNTAYMTCAYIGGSIGSTAGARVYGACGGGGGAGWLGVCGVLVGLAGVVLGWHMGRGGAAQRR